MTRHARTVLLAPLAVAVLAVVAGCGKETDETTPHEVSVPAAKALPAPAAPSPRAATPAPPGSHVAVGQEAPDFELTTTDGKTFKLSDQRGKVVLINFFATWCRPCLTELPHLQRDVYEKIKGEHFTMIAVGREHDNAEVARFKEKHRLTFPMAGDPKRDVFALYADKSIPRTVVVGADGKILFQSTGYSDKEFQQMLALIRETARPR